MFIFFLSLKKISTSSLKVMQVCTAIDIYIKHTHTIMFTHRKMFEPDYWPRPNTANKVTRSIEHFKQKFTD